jgi:hypothetical protein
MSDVITQYQNWKQQGEDLRVKARQAMESRFRDLLSEAVRIAEEYRADFGAQLKPGSPVTAFRYKAGAKAKTKKAPKVQPKAEPAAPTPNPKLSGLQKRLATARKKMDDAKAAGKPTKALEDRVYEIEDELRLAGHA